MERNDDVDRESHQIIRSCKTLEELQDCLLEIALTIGTLTVNDKVESCKVGYRAERANGVELSFKGDPDVVKQVSWKASKKACHLWIKIFVKGGAANLIGKTKKGGRAGASRRGNQARPVNYPSNPRFVNIGNKGQHQSTGLEVATGEYNNNILIQCLITFEGINSYLFLAIKCIQYYLAVPVDEQIDTLAKQLRARHASHRFRGKYVEAEWLAWAKAVLSGHGTEATEPSTTAFLEAHSMAQAERGETFVPQNSGPRGAGPRPPHFYDPQQQQQQQQPWAPGMFAQPPNPFGGQYNYPPQYPQPFFNSWPPPPMYPPPPPERPPPMTGRPQHPGGMPGVQPPGQQYNDLLKGREQVEMNRDVFSKKHPEEQLLYTGQKVYVETRGLGNANDKIRIKFDEPGGAFLGKSAVIPESYVDPLSEDDDDAEEEFGEDDDAGQDTG